MTDLLAILDGLFADLGKSDSPSVPTLPTPFPTSTDAQHIERQRFSHTDNAPSANDGCDRPAENDFSSVAGARARSNVWNVGNVGNVGNEATTPAVSVTYDFPHSSPFVGNKEEKWEIPLRSASPQRSDWWSGPAMAAVDAPMPPAGDPLPISPADVRAGVARELDALTEVGRTGPAALRDAIEVVRGKIRNAPVLAERQAHDGRCHVCGEPLDSTRPEVAILQAKPGKSLWLHSGACHAEHSRRRATLVDEIMAGAGYELFGREIEVAQRSAVP